MQSPIGEKSPVVRIKGAIDFLDEAQRHGLTVPRAGERSYVTGSIRGWSRSHLTYITVAAGSKSASSLRSLPQLQLNFQFNIISK